MKREASSRNLESISGPGTLGRRPASSFFSRSRARVRGRAAVGRVRGHGILAADHRPHRMHGTGTLLQEGAGQTHGLAEAALHGPVPGPGQAAHEPGQGQGLFPAHGHELVAADSAARAAGQRGSGRGPDGRQKLQDGHLARGHVQVQAQGRGPGETENKDLTLSRGGIRIVGHGTSRTPSSPKSHDGKARFCSRESVLSWRTCVLTRFCRKKERHWGSAFFLKFPLLIFPRMPGITMVLFATIRSLS